MDSKIETRMTDETCYQLRDPAFFNALKQIFPVVYPTDASNGSAYSPLFSFFLLLFLLFLIFLTVLCVCFLKVFSCSNYFLLHSFDYESFSSACLAFSLMLVFCSSFLSPMVSIACMLLQCGVGALYASDQPDSFFASICSSFPLASTPTTSGGHYLLPGCTVSLTFRPVSTSAPFCCSPACCCFFY